MEGTLLRVGGDRREWDPVRARAADKIAGLIEQVSLEPDIVLGPLFRNAGGDGDVQPLPSPLRLPRE